MAECKTYKTENRTKILDYLIQNADRTVSVQDILFSLQQEDVDVNVSTIYRYLNKLSKEGTVLKYVAKKGEMAVFQYVEKNRDCTEHLHMQCSRCGKIIHLDCAFMKDISEHILTHHGFELQCSQSILFGLCQDCRRTGL